MRTRQSRARADIFHRAQKISLVRIRGMQPQNKGAEGGPRGGDSAGPRFMQPAGRPAGRTGEKWCYETFTIRRSESGTRGLL